MRTDDIKKLIHEGYFVIRPVDTPKISIMVAICNDWPTGDIDWIYWHYPTTPGYNDPNFAEFSDKEQRDEAINTMLNNAKIILD